MIIFQAAALLTSALLAMATPGAPETPTAADSRLGEAAERAYRAGMNAQSSKEKRRHFQEGVELSRKALAQDPNDPAALLWLAGNLAQEALTHGKLRALRVIPDVERTLLRLEQHHPQYDHAAAARALGSLYYKAPAVISVGSSAKAAHYFGLALERAPDYPGNQALAAEFYEDQGKCARATQLAQRVLAADLRRYGQDGQDWRKLAEEVLDDCR